MCRFIAKFFDAQPLCFIQSRFNHLEWPINYISDNFRQTSNLTAIIDRNRLQIDGCTESVKALDNLQEKIKAFNWNVIEIDGHNIQEIYLALESSKSSDKPTAIIANTTKGKGVSFMENNAAWHGKAPSQEDYEKAMMELK